MNKKLRAKDGILIGFAKRVKHNRTILVDSELLLYIYKKEPQNMVKVIWINKEIPDKNEN